MQTAGVLRGAKFQAVVENCCNILSGEFWVRSKLVFGRPLISIEPWVRPYDASSLCRLSVTHVLWLNCTL